MAVEKIKDSTLDAEGRFHANLKDVPGKTAEDMKAFFDYIPRNVLIPKINEIIDDNESNKTETDEKLDDKANSSEIYSKTETDTLLKEKANAANVYTKTETDALLSPKADADTVYTKTETDALVSPKADADTVYTKTETDQKLDQKLDVNTAALNFANSLKGTASGAVVTVDDASPIEHSLNIKVESKNLFNTAELGYAYGCFLAINDSNSFTLTSTMNAAGQCSVSLLRYYDVGTYRVSGDDIVVSDGTSKGGCALLIRDAIAAGSVTSNTINFGFTVTTAGYYRIYFYGRYSADEGYTYTFSNIQIEKGSAKTAFTPFVDVEGITVSKLVDGVEVQSATASADGTVTGLAGDSSFELTSDTDEGSVLINLGYNRDINKAFAELTQAIISLGGTV